MKKKKTEREAKSVRKELLQKKQMQDTYEHRKQRKCISVTFPSSRNDSGKPKDTWFENCKTNPFLKYLHTKNI